MWTEDGKIHFYLESANHAALIMHQIIYSRIAKEVATHACRLCHSILCACIYNYLHVLWLYNRYSYLARLLQYIVIDSAL